MDGTVLDRCGFCWSLLADGMPPFTIRMMDRSFCFVRGLEVADAEN